MIVLGKDSLYIKGTLSVIMKQKQSLAFDRAIVVVVVAAVAVVVVVVPEAQFFCLCLKTPCPQHRQTRH